MYTFTECHCYLSCFILVVLWFSLSIDAVTVVLYNTMKTLNLMDNITVDQVKFIITVVKFSYKNIEYIGKSFSSSYN